MVHVGKGILTLNLQVGVSLAFSSWQSCLSAGYYCVGALRSWSFHPDGALWVCGYSFVLVSVNRECAAHSLGLGPGRPVKTTE